MTMTPRLRKFALTAHVLASVGWLGAVLCSLALGVAALVSKDAATVRGVALTLRVVGWFVLVPMSFASLLTGLIQALGTRWGLFRHYWVLVKLAMNVAAIVVLLLYMQSIDFLAGMAKRTLVAGGGLTGLRDPSPVVHAGAAAMLLVVATVLSVYKPRGLTRYGRRQERDELG